MQTATNDKTMRESIVSELDWDAQIDAERIAVSAQDGTIVLSGHVPNYADKWAAVRAAERVYGVRTVADEIEVKLSGSNVRDDSDIAEDITRQLHSSTVIPDSVKAEVKNGRVTLRGEVQWGYQRTEAARTLRYVWGVQGLDNLLNIVPKAAKSADVEAQVATAIERMAHLDARSMGHLRKRNGSPSRACALVLRKAHCRPGRSVSARCDQGRERRSRNTVDRVTGPSPWRAADRASLCASTSDLQGFS